MSARGSPATARGEQRRRALIEAAGGLIESEGFGAVTHRAVAARAQLPLAATTYYFSSREELVQEAARAQFEAHLRDARGAAARLGPSSAGDAELAQVVLEVVVGAGARAEPARALLNYERYVEAARVPRLRPLLREWNAELLGLVNDLLRDHGRPHGRDVARLLVGLLDGLLVTMLVEGEADPVAAARDALTGVLARGLALAGPDPPDGQC